MGHQTAAEHRKLQLRPHLKSKVGVCCAVTAVALKFEPSAFQKLSHFSHQKVNQEEPACLAFATAVLRTEPTHDKTSGDIALLSLWQKLHYLHHPKFFPMASGCDCCRIRHPSRISPRNLLPALSISDETLPSYTFVCC